MIILSVLFQKKNKLMRILRTITFAFVEAGSVIEVAINNENKTTTTMGFAMTQILTRQIYCSKQ